MCGWGGVEYALLSHIFVTPHHHHNWSRTPGEKKFPCSGAVLILLGVNTELIYSPNPSILQKLALRHIQQWTVPAVLQNSPRRDRSGRDRSCASRISGSKNISPLQSPLNGEIFTQTSALSCNRQRKEVFTCLSGNASLCTRQQACRTWHIQENRELLQMTCNCMQYTPLQHICQQKGV